MRSTPGDAGIDRELLTLAPYLAAWE